MTESDAEPVQAEEKVGKKAEEDARPDGDAREKDTEQKKDEVKPEDVEN